MKTKTLIDALNETVAELDRQATEVYEYKIAEILRRLSVKLEQKQHDIKHKSPSMNGETNHSNT